MAFQTFGTRGSEGDFPISIEYIDKPGLGRIALLNALLFVVTLTIYRFWAKTNVRRHIWSCVRINGEPLEYTGRGMELLLGFLIVFGLFFLPVFLVLMVMQMTLGLSTPCSYCSISPSFCFFCCSGAWRSTGHAATSSRAPYGAA